MSSEESKIDAPVRKIRYDFARMEGIQIVYVEAANNNELRIPIKEYINRGKPRFIFE